MRRRKNRRDDDDNDNGFAEWGGYMEAKKQKLLQQFNVNVENSVLKESDIFKGIAIFVNGYTNPTSEELKSLMSRHGGVFHHYESRKTTHIVASNLPDTKIKQIGKGVPIVKPEWITDSISAGKLLDFKNFLLYTNQNSKQPRLLFDSLPRKSTLVENESSDNNQEIQKDSVIGSPSKTNYSILNILEEISPKKNLPVENDDQMESTSVDLFPDESYSSNTISNQTLQGEKNIAISKNRPGTSKITRTATDPLFLTEFYQNSRLHLISTLGAEYKLLVNNMREKWDGKYPGRENLIKQYQNVHSDDFIPSTPLIMHIDMDCFFVSVGLRNRPDLKGKPVAVTHAKGSQNLNRNESNFETEKSLYKKNLLEDDLNLNKLDSRSSMSEVASCSYEARKHGVKNGMFLGTALKMCPELITIPYDFEGYREVSSVLYKTIAQYTLDIEAVSCDEMYVDVSAILLEAGVSVDQWATYIRNEIMEATGCSCSTGFGSNRLQARLATRKAKPCGQFYLTPESVEDYIAKVPLADLPGVGYVTISKLRSLGLNTCSDVQKKSLQFLQIELGSKMGEQIYDQTKGIDSKPLSFYHERKSVSADVNYGIRFKTYDESLDFLQRLSEEVFGRLLEAGMKAARCVSLKVLVRAPDAPRETAKYLGCGVCNSINKSTTKGNIIADSAAIFKEAKYLLDQIKAPPEDFRGIGIQLTRLEKSAPDNKLLTEFLKRGVCQKNESENNQLESSPKVKEIAIQCSGNSFIEEELVQEIPKKEDNKTTANKKTRGKLLKSSSSSSIVGTLKNYFNETRSQKSIVVKKESKIGLEYTKNIDVKVLKELPQEIRDEILKEYKISADEFSKLEEEQNESGSSKTPSSITKSTIFSNLKWEELKSMIVSWLQSNSDPLNCDVVQLGEYLRDLALNREIEFLHTLIKFLYRNVKEVEKCVWHEAYFKIVDILQQGMMATYSNILLVPKKFPCEKHS